MATDNQLYLNKLHTDILSIMDEIDRVCRENNLKYYLIGGTLLGAIRHKGFIPWDDDLDIVMPREDLDKFIELSSKKLKPEFELQWHTNNAMYANFFPKICIKNTLFAERRLVDEAQLGIFVDIFPLDSSASYTKELNRKKRVIMKLLGLIIDKSLVTENKLQILKGKIISSCFKGMILQAINFILKTIHKSGDTHYANLGSQYKLEKQTMPKSWYGEGVRVPFEDRSYVVPTEYLKVVTSIFGVNYMQLPPIDMRRTHYPKQVIFSDGSQMFFDKPEKMYTVRELEELDTPLL